MHYHPYPNGPDHEPTYCYDHILETGEPFGDCECMFGEKWGCVICEENDEDS